MAYLWFFGKDFLKLEKIERNVSDPQLDMI